MTKPATQTLFIALFALLLLFQYRLWFDQDGILKVFHLKKAVASQIFSNQDLIQQNQLLLSDIKQLRQETSAIEEHARNDLGMVRQGEVFYRTVGSN